MTDRLALALVILGACLAYTVGFPWNWPPTVAGLAIAGRNLGLAYTRKEMRR